MSIYYNLIFNLTVYGFHLFIIYNYWVITVHYIRDLYSRTGELYIITIQPSTQFTMNMAFAETSHKKKTDKYLNTRINKIRWLATAVVQRPELEINCLRDPVPPSPPPVNLEYVWKNLKNAEVSGCMVKCSKSIFILIMATDIYFKHICRF